MSGHVFVIQGSLAHLDYDAVIVPTDNRFSVTGSWQEVLGTKVDATGHSVADALRPQGWTTTRYGRALEPDIGITPPRPTWFIDSAWYGQSPEKAVDELAARLAATLRDIAGAGLSPRRGRTHPLVALPTLGTGGGGFDPIRGTVIDALITTCQEAVDDASFDVVIVAGRPSDYTAFQTRRKQLLGHERHLGPDLHAAAERLAELARQGDLALFLGAGVGIPAGLPTWKDLLEVLSETAQVDISELESDLDKAELLHLALGNRFGSEVASEIDVTKRYAITHAMLASLGCAEIVTTNYDQLYEKAFCDIAVGGEIPSLPFDRRIAGTPWVLKMHGDIREPGSIVLTRSDFVSYDAKSRPLGSVVQSLMMTKHLLVVGASMTDDNFLRLAHEVFAFHEAGAKEAGRVDTPSAIGTVLTLVNVPAKARLWENRFTYVPISNATTRPNQARDLTIFLDLVSMLTSTSAHLLDPRYSTLLGSEDERAAARSAQLLRAAIDKLPTSTSDNWQSLSEALTELGAPRQVS